MGSMKCGLGVRPVKELLSCSKDQPISTGDILVICSSGSLTDIWLVVLGISPIHFPLAHFFFTEHTTALQLLILAFRVFITFGLFRLVILFWPCSFRFLFSWRGLSAVQMLTLWARKMKCRCSHGAREVYAATQVKAHFLSKKVCIGMRRQRFRLERDLDKFIIRA